MINSGESSGAASEDIAIGLEFDLLTQQTVVDEFRRIASRDVGEAALRFFDFAHQLSEAASGGNVQVRSMIGGADSGSRAGLIDILGEHYDTCSLEVRQKVSEVALNSLTADNDLYVQMAVARVQNPLLVADMGRHYWPALPRPGYLEGRLHATDNLSEEGLESWLSFPGSQNYRALAVALQKTEISEDTFKNLWLRHQELFEGAAHIVASFHDMYAVRSKLEGEARQEKITAWRDAYQPLFATSVKRAIQVANWIPIVDPSFRF